MKKILIFAFLFIFLSGCSGNSIRLKNNSNDKKTINTLNIEQHLQNTFIASSPSKDKFFINPNEGWKAAYKFIGMFIEEMILYKTKDGGKTWSEIANSENNGSTLPGGNKIGMSFISSTKGWITSDTPWSGKVDLYMTEDGGTTWSEQKLEVPNELKDSDIYSFPPLFFSMSEGILLTFVSSENGEQNLLFYITHDGGEDWIPFMNDNMGSSGEIKWNFKRGNQENYEVTYCNSIWIFEENTWMKKVE